MRHTFSRSSPAVQVGVAIAAAAALVAAADALWLGPTRTDIASQARALAATRGEEAAAAAAERRIPQLQQRIHSLQARLASLRAAAPGDIDAAGLLAVLQALAGESGLSITAFKRSPSSAPEWLTAWSVSVEFEGTYEDLVRFLASVADHGAMLAATSLRLRTHDRPAEGITLAGSARITLYAPAALSQDGAAGQGGAIGAAPPDESTAEEGVQ